MNESTLVLIKPDAICRGLAGQVITRLENKGLKLTAAKLIKMDTDLAAKHYSVHKDKYFYQRLIDYIIATPVLAMVWQGKDAISVIRTLCGKTFGTEALPGTIRGDFSAGRFNIIHSSDCPESAEYEIRLYFNNNEILDYDLDSQNWFK